MMPTPAPGCGSPSAAVPPPDVPEAEITRGSHRAALIRLLDAGGVDVMVLDGEAQPAGGMGVCRQAKDEIYDCPPVAAHRRPG